MAIPFEPLALGIKSYDPMESIGQMQRLKALKQESLQRQQELQMTQMKMAEAQRQMTDAQSLRDAYTASVVPQQSQYTQPGLTLGGMSLPDRQVDVQGPLRSDPSLMLSALGKTSPWQVPGVQAQMDAHQAELRKQAEESAKTQAETRYKVGQSNELDYKLIHDHITAASAAFGPLLQMDDASAQQKYPEVLQNLVRQGIMTPQDAAAHPTFDRADLTQRFNQGIDAKDQVAQKMEAQKMQTAAQQHQDTLNMQKRGQDITVRGQNMADQRSKEANQAWTNGGGLTGDAFLQTLSPGLQSQVKAMANGDIAVPSPSTRSPQAQQLRTAVMQYDPTYSDARYKGKQNFKTSGDAQNIVQLSTAMEHANRALLNSDKIGFAPAVGNKTLESADSARYMQDVEFMTGEVGKLVKNGVLTMDEANKISNGLTAARHDVRTAALHETMDLLGGKTRAMFQKYKISTGQDMPIKDFFDASSQERLTKFGLVDGATQQAPQGGGSTTRIQASDGSMHDVPTANLNAARQLDPGLKVVQ